MSRRHRTGPPQLVVISWRDIPAQVTVSGAAEAKALLPARFQRAIDRAARVAGMTEHRAYISAWHRTSLPLHGDPHAAVTATVARLDAAYDRGTLETLVRHGGRVPPGDPTPVTSSSAGRGTVGDPGGGP